MGVEKKCPPEGLPAWLATYADLVTLLMAFFVLLFAFSTMDAQKFTTLMEAFNGSFGVLDGGKTVSPEALVTNARIQSKGTEHRFQKLAKELEEKIEEIKEANGEEAAGLEANVKITERGIEISFGASNFFSLGKAELRTTAEEILDSVYVKLRGIPNTIAVEGHTDNLPINTIRYPSNWELSTARATTVLKYLINQDSSLNGRIFAAGYADTRPIAINGTINGRSKNRRVDIIILKTFEEQLGELNDLEIKVLTDKKPGND